MEPIAVWVQPNGEWSLVHRCVHCRTLRSNRIAGDDNEFVLMQLASRAIAMPPFPLEPLGRAQDDDAE
jgi:ribosome biogenesis GTPase